MKFKAIVAITLSFSLLTACGANQHKENNSKSNDTTKKTQETDNTTQSNTEKQMTPQEFESSRFETGYIKFIENGKAVFWYDLMPPPNFTQSKYLMIYKDNKTLLSSKTAIEVHLTKKK